MTSSPHPPKRPKRAAAWRFLLVFAAIALVGFAIEVVPWFDLHVIKPLTAGIAWSAGQLVQLFGGAASVDGNVIRHPGGFAVAVYNGCSGIEAVILLSAAILAFPAGWRSRAIGLLLGTLAVMLINLLRVISLYYLGQYSREWFDWAHLYAWDILIMLDVLMVFLCWLRTLPPPAARHAAPA